MRFIINLFLISILSLGLTAVAIPSIEDGSETYYTNMKSCEPSVFTYDAIMRNVKNTKQIVGKQDGKCVIREQISPQHTLVCKLPMRVASKYAKENLNLLKERLSGTIYIKSDYVEKIENDKNYCSIELKQN